MKNYKYIGIYGLVDLGEKADLISGIVYSVFESTSGIFYMQEINDNGNIENMLSILNDNDENISKEELFNQEEFKSKEEIGLENKNIEVNIGEESIWTYLITPKTAVVSNQEEFKNIVEELIDFNDAKYNEIKYFLSNENDDIYKDISEEEYPNNTKEVIILRDDVRNDKGHKVQKGKFVAQGSHGAVANLIQLLRNGRKFSEDLAKKTNKDFVLHLEVKKNTALHNWLTTSFTKPVLACHSEEELLNIYERAIKEGLNATLIQDNGLTEFGGVKTYTSVAIGPDYIDNINKITGELKPFK